MDGQASRVMIPAHQSWSSKFLFYRNMMDAMFFFSSVEGCSVGRQVRPVSLNRPIQPMKNPVISFRRRDSGREIRWFFSEPHPVPPFKAAARWKWMRKRQLIKVLKYANLTGNVQRRNCNFSQFAFMMRPIRRLQLNMKVALKYDNKQIEMEGSTI